ncbi:hypothetical protein N9F27_01255 [Crocinitomicaceae bacterium]|uniref:Uncharacterized protein n=1 Tax=uncultured Flavobacteriia bacterium TaxID=212695 RepID=H6RGF2_9BACT|nr:hypothetical protein [Crocinitomicaceae bacterium]MDC1194041.1 hypothetical protein [Crocinitomicaceae bacterium]MDG1348017.1 hypothetical protein [Crocinitomicaceae bacterium]MDG2463834.1 hypothetical protein [Crocinitomicaceae bacterium]CCG00113.1 hypothetical protein VIS_S3CIB80034 [uncultured Flavobacteriia bacterium]
MILIDKLPVGVVSDGVRLLLKADAPIYVFKSHFSKHSLQNMKKNRLMF